MQRTNSIASQHGHHDALCFTGDGDLVLGSSNLTGRYWTGCLTYNAASTPTRPLQSPPLSTALLGSSLSDIQWIEGSSRFITACDSGSVTLHELVEGELSCKAEIKGHSNIVSSVQITCDTSHIISASFDRSVRVWDLTELTQLQCYTGHSTPVLSVSGHPTSPSVFLSCSQDGRVVIWDTRNTKPGKVLVDGGLTLSSCVTWLAGDTYLIGTEDGLLLQCDARNANKSSVSVVTASPHTRTVRRIAISPTRSDWVATASNDCTVVVTKFDVNLANTVYVDKSHKDFVQDVAWHPKDSSLYSCSWDSTVLARDLIDIEGAGDGQHVKVNGGVSQN